MTKKGAKKIREGIIKGFKAAIAELYRDARKNKWELVVLKNGKVKKIRP